MSPIIQRITSRCSRWVRGLARGTYAAAAGVAQRVGAPTLLTVPVSAALLTRVVGVRPEQSLEEVAHLLVSTRNDCLPIVDHGRPVAVITRSDLAAGLLRSGPHALVASAPSHHAIAVTPTDSLAHVLQRLSEMPDAVAVIVDHGRPVGLLTAEAVQAYLAQADHAA